MNTTNLYPISHHFGVITAYWSNYIIVIGECLYLTHSFGVKPWTLDCKMWPCIMWCTTYLDTLDRL